MKSENIHNLLEISDELKNNTLKELNLTKSEVDEAVEKVVEWLTAQPHLQDVKPDVRQIECLFVASKGSIERTKQGMDMYYAIKSNIPEMFQNRDPAGKDFRVCFDGVSCTIMRSVSASGHRIMCMKFYEDTSRFQIYDFYKILLMLFEVRARYDYASGCIYVCDLTTFNMGHLMKFHPAAVKKCIFAIQGPFLARIKGIHIVCGTSYAESFIAMFRTILKAKLQERMFIHKNVEGIHQHVDKSLLPEDFGGTQKPLREIEESWFEELLHWRDWFVEEDKNISDESKRPGESNPDEYLGIHGSFRKLAVD